MLSVIYLADPPHRLLNVYVANYSKEEIAAEGLIETCQQLSNIQVECSGFGVQDSGFGTRKRRTARQFIIRCWMFMAFAPK